MPHSPTRLRLARALAAPVALAALAAALALAPLSAAPAATATLGQPPTAQLRCAPVPEVVTPPGVRLEVELLDAEGAPLGGRSVRWERLDGAAVVLTRRVGVTDADGLAATEHILPYDAGLDDMISIVASFSGDEEHGSAACTFEFRRRSASLPQP
jgi:hypothetical protein